MNLVGANTGRAVLLSFAIAVAGCTGSAKSAIDDTTDGTDLPTDPGLDGNFTFGAFQGVFDVTPLNGTAPLNITITLDAVNAGDDLAWSLFIGSVATYTSADLTLPASLNHTLAAGNHTLTYELTSNNETLELTAVVVVLPGGPAAGTALRVEPFEAKGSVVVGVQAPACGAAGLGAKHEFPLEVVAAEADGTPSVASEVKLAMTSNALTGMDLDMFFLAPDGKTLGSGTSATSAEAITVKGPLAAGTYTVQVLACAAADVDFTITGATTYLAA